MLEAYRDGRSADAFASLAAMQPDQLRDQIRALVASEYKAVKNGAFNGSTTRPRIWIQTAIVMHADYARTGVRGGVLVDDVGDERNRHIDIAATLARSLFDPPRGHRSDRAGSDEAFLRVWFRYLAAEWMSRGPYNKAWDAIDMGRQQAGEDAELDLAEGALHELTWRLAHEERQRVFGFAGDLEHAERALKKALGVDPHLDEARLRLARVQTKRGRPADAIDTLAPMESPATEPGFLYLARLFEGDAWEAQQELRRAEAAYRAAMAVLPQSASAPLSLAHLLFIHGRRDEASDLVRSLATSATAQSQQEPWLPYRLGTSWRSTGYLDDLRDIVMVHK